MGNEDDTSAADSEEVTLGSSSIWQRKIAKSIASRRNSSAVLGAS